jgi:hypothetical protein
MGSGMSGENTSNRSLRSYVMASEHMTRERFCLPLEVQGHQFVPAREWLVANLARIPEFRLRSALKKAFVAQVSTVLLEGQSFQTTVYVPKGGTDDFSYVIVDETGIPVSTEALPPLPDEPFIRGYLDRVRESLAATESILPDQQAHLWTEYLERTCEMFSGRGSAARVFTDWRAITRDTRVLLLGRAGAGKTTLLRRIAIGLADDEPTAIEYLLPVYVQLRNWRSVGGLEGLVRREIAALATDEMASSLKTLGESGRLIFLLDGLDELATEHRPKAFDDLDAFIQRNSKCRFVIASRPTAAPQKLRETFSACVLRDLSQSQMQEMCSDRLHGRGRSWRSFWERISTEPDLLEMSSNPLILTLLTARFVRDSLSPHYVGEAISAIVDALSDEWDSVRGVCRTLAPTLTPKQKLALLRHLAGRLSAENKTSFSDSDYAQIMEGMAPAEEYGDLLGRLEEQTSLVRRHDDSTWTFAHAAIQDYLSALEVAAKASAAVLSETSSHDERWMRLWPYICWSACDASELLREKAAGPYNFENILLATKAFSQNLLVHRDVVRGYALSVIWLLENCLKDTTLEMVKEDERREADIEQVTCRVKAGAGSADRLRELGELLQALHQARDGIARAELRDRIATSRNATVRDVVSMVMDEGLLRWALGQTPDGFSLDLSFERDAQAKERPL